MRIIIALLVICFASESQAGIRSFINRVFNRNCRCGIRTHRIVKISHNTAKRTTTNDKRTNPTNTDNGNTPSTDTIVSSDEPQVNTDKLPTGSPGRTGDDIGPPAPEVKSSRTEIAKPKIPNFMLIKE